MWYLCTLINLEQHILRIVIDSGIPYVEGLFEPFAEVVYCLGSDISADIVAAADALIVRTRTRCDRALLRGSGVKHIATATIGFDHIDLDYCRENGIKVTSAAGCNARAVLQWFGAVVVELSKSQGWNPEDKTVGVVGVGNVGRLIKEYAELWGFRVVCCDPPRAAAEGISEFKRLEEVASVADILTLHTPLDSTTYHFIDEHILRIMPAGAILLNASRGEVVSSEALKHGGVSCVLDVWESEPMIDTTLLENTLIATHHIAGYSKQGKANASAIVVRDIAQTLGFPITNWYPNVERVAPRAISWEELCATTLQYIDITAESNVLKSHPAEFERLRNRYVYRDEFF